MLPPRPTPRAAAAASAYACNPAAQQPCLAHYCWGALAQRCAHTGCRSSIDGSCPGMSTARTYTMFPPRLTLRAAAAASASTCNPAAKQLAAQQQAPPFFFLELFFKLFFLELDFSFFADWTAAADCTATGAATDPDTASTMTGAGAAGATPVIASISSCVRGM
eukprot:CAMPEP_0198606894 /NCGR_PEP_ID=MMETSP1462-20131121/155124_1 /TAXON_ID=1333877 /ORGANISM="Brandtodinium nutriculum, Strain RCC3387" /LENGTH=163 /DNA_ID=CAMNT_0044338699 /DNA_START=278 /DNA_END=768 /DNA_ORIENTATION=+